MKFPVSFGQQTVELDDMNVYRSVIFAIILFKIAVLMFWGPGMAPDTAGYTQFAAMILEGSDWVSNADVKGSAMPNTAFRIIGYPIIIALTQLISSDNWQVIIVLLQFTLTVASLFSLSRLMFLLGMNPLAGAFCLVSTGLSFSLLLDNMILTDSLAASIFVIVLSENAIASLRGNSFKAVDGLFFGVLIALAFLIREGIAVLSMLFVIPFLLRAYLSRGQRLRSVVSVILFFVPLLLCIQIYKSWNEGRTGYRFVTTGGQTVYLQGVMDAAAKDPKILSGNDPIDLAARDIVKEYSFSEVLAIQGRLFEEGYTAPELADLSKQKYFSSWFAYPGSMLRMTIGHIRESYAMLTFRPLDSVRQTGLWINGQKPWADHKELRKNILSRLDAFILFMGEMVERVIGVVITLSFVFVPVAWFVSLCLGRSTRKRETLVFAGLWLVYFGVLLAHAMVHLETRYLAGIVPFSTLIGCYCIQVTTSSVKS